MPAEMIGGVRVTLADVVGNGLQRRERTFGRRTERCHCHHARECQTRMRVDRSGQRHRRRPAAHLIDQDGRRRRDRPAQDSATGTRSLHRRSPSASTSRCRSTECTRSAYDATEAHLLVCNAPTKCHRSVGAPPRIAGVVKHRGDVARPLRRPPGRGSHRHPRRRARASSTTSEAGKVFVTAMTCDVVRSGDPLARRPPARDPSHRAGCSRAHAFGVRGCRPRALRRASTSWHLPDECRLATGAVVSAVGERVVDPRACSHQLRGRPATPASRELVDDAGLDVECRRRRFARRDRAPRDDSDATAAAMSSPHFIAPTTNGGADRRAHAAGARARASASTIACDDAGHQPSAAAMQDAEHADRGIGQRDERAIGRERSQRDVRRWS